MLAWYKRRFLFWELVLPTAVVFVLFVWPLAGYVIGPIQDTLDGHRAEVYGALASIFGSLLGFTLAAVAIVLSVAQSARLRVVRESRHYDELWAIFRSCMRWLAIATSVTLVALIADTNETPRIWLTGLALFVSLVGVLRIARTVWVLERIIGIVTKPVRR